MFEEFARKQKTFYYFLDHKKRETLLILCRRIVIMSKVLSKFRALLQVS